MLVVVLLVTCYPATDITAAAVTQAGAVKSLLRWARFTQNDANTVGSWIELACYVDLVLDTDDFAPDATRSGTYYNTLRKQANVLYRQNRVSKIPIYPFINVHAQPQNLTPNRGSDAVLTVATSVSNGNDVSYQWYSCADGNKTDATAVDGATEANFTVPTEEYGDFYYFCRFSAENMESVDSNVVSVDVPFPTFEDCLALSSFEYTVDAEAGTVLLSK